MGRAKGITGEAASVKDAFTSVVGRRRGLSYDQEKFSSAPPELALSVPFSDDAVTAERRLRLTHHMRIALGAKTVLDFAVESQAYDELFLFENGYTSNQRLTMRAKVCEEDLEALVKQGVCQKGQMRRGNREIPIYSIGDWSKEHQKAYDQWNEKGILPAR